MLGPCDVSGKDVRNKAPSASKAFVKISSFTENNLNNLNTDLACPPYQHGSGARLGKTGDSISKHTSLKSL